MAERYILVVGAGTWESYHAITTLLYRYAELMDAADFDGVAKLFEHATLTNEGVDQALKGAQEIGDLYRRTSRVHDDGTLRTRHLTTNVIVDIDERLGTAQARSTFVVFQQTATLPLQPIVSGRYRDHFVRRGNVWRFDRRHIVVDHVGNVSEHLTFDLAQFRAEHPG